MHKRTRFSKSAERMQKADDKGAPVAPKRLYPPLIEQFHVAVDQQLKSGYGTYEAAEKAARAIKT